MNSFIEYPSTRYQQELTWLKRFGWLFPLAGIPAGLLFDGMLWVAITLDRAYMPQTPAAWITAKGLLFGLVIAAFPLAWLVGLFIENKTTSWNRRYSFAAILAVVCLMLAELFFRSYFFQSSLWLSVRSRSGSDYFVREISVLRLDEASRRAAHDDRPGIVVAGSSQMLHTLDVARLSELTGLPVHRRATAGMFPVELCAARGFMDFNSENVLLLMLSGFDLGGRDDLYPDAIRPLATPEGVSDMVDASAPRFVLDRWRSYVDLVTASRFELWRSRDYFRFVFNHPFSENVTISTAEASEQVDRQRLAYTQLGRNSDMVALSESALQIFLQSISSRVKRIVVVEGRVHPDYPDAGIYPLSATMKMFLAEQEKKGLIEYWPVESQQMNLIVEDWLDMAHVNQGGRVKYTEMFARVLQATATKQP